VEGSVFPAPDSAIELSKIQLKGEIDLKENALKLSGLVLLSIITLEGIFSYIQKPLELPETLWQIIWMVICFPWVGVGGGKIAGYISKAISKNATK